MLIQEPVNPVTGPDFFTRRLFYPSHSRKITQEPPLSAAGQGTDDLQFHQAGKNRNMREKQINYLIRWTFSECLPVKYSQFDDFFS
jgi:hypothetical protein